MSEEIIIYKEPFVMIYHRSDSNRRGRFVLDENSPERYTHGWEEMKLWYKLKYPHSTIRNYTASYHGKDSKYSVPKYTKRLFDIELANSWAYRDYKLEDILENG